MSTSRSASERDAAVSGPRRSRTPPDYQKCVRERVCARTRGARTHPRVCERRRVRVWWRARRWCRPRRDASVCLAAVTAAGRLLPPCCPGRVCALGRPGAAPAGVVTNAGPTESIGPGAAAAAPAGPCGRLTGRQLSWLPSQSLAHRPPVCPLRCVRERLICRIEPSPASAPTRRGTAGRRAGRPRDSNSVSPSSPSRASVAVGRSQLQ